jgi:hypothetical protein
MICGYSSGRNLSFAHFERRDEQTSFFLILKDLRQKMVSFAHLVGETVPWPVLTGFTASEAC